MKKNNKINFTKNSILNLELPSPHKRNYFYDKNLNGLGIMVFPSSAKTFFLSKRVNRKSKKIKLGAFPEMTVEQARKRTYCNRY